MKGTYRNALVTIDTVLVQCSSNLVVAILNMTSVSERPHI